MKKSKLKHNEQDSLHLVEFSQGKPNEISFNVLGKKSSSPLKSEKKGFFSRHKSKGSYEGFGPSMAIGSGENAPLKDALSTNKMQKAVDRETKNSVKNENLRSKGKHSQPQQNRFANSSEEVFLPNAQGFSAEAHEEIKRRQKRRKRARVFSIMLVAVVVLALVAAGAFWLYQENEKNKSNRELIQQACYYIEQSDETIVAIDEFFSQPFGEDTVSKAETLQTQIPQALGYLDNAKKYATRADESIEGTSSDKEAAQSAYNASVSRETLLQVAEAKLAIDIDAKNSLDGMATIEQDIDESQYLLAEAASAVEQTSSETVSSSTSKLQEAKGKLEEAQTLLNEIIERFPDGDFSLYSEYLTKRLEEVQYGLLSNEAILIQDKKTAESNNELYNTTDQETVTLAKSFPETFAQPLVDAYKKATENYDEQFNQLRNDVGGYDAFLRSYLGNETQKSE